MDKTNGEDHNSNGSEGSNEKEWNNYEEVHLPKQSTDTLYPQRIIDQSHLESLYQSKASHGVAGSQNLGNTCFMNSSIQCMSNSVDLTAYFLSNEYKKEINPNNKLGLGGALAESWNELLHELWEERGGCVNARNFKITIARKAKMFSGFSQHDSHEFITFFLDYLNEDLNKVSVKPYREIEEQGDNEKDIEAAKRFWQLHLDRNNSIVTDLFSGQFKSTIQCPNCHWISRTYDPFNTLSLPIPTLQTFLIFFVSKYGIRKTIKLQISIPNDSLFGDLGHIIKSSLNLEADFEKLRFMIVKDNEMIKLTLPKDRVDKYNDRYNETLIFCCDTDSKIKGDIIQAPIYFSMNGKLSVHPRLLSLTGDMTYGELKLLAFLYARKFFNLPIDQTEYDMESKILLDQFKKSSDQLIEICKREYEKLFKRDGSTLSDKEKEFLNDLPYELYMRRDDEVHYLIRSPRKANKNDVMISFKEEDPIKPLIAMQKDKWKFCLDIDHQSKYLIEKGEKEINSCKIVPVEDRTVSLADCLESFQLTEKLEKNNEWYCKKCKTHQLAHKKMEIFYLPKLLIVHLKRFSTEGRGYRGMHGFLNKISTTVDFPLNDLDMSDFVVGPKAENSKYDLYGVSQHYGGCGGGHYTAVCKNNGKWYDYNDSSVSQTNENHVVSDAAYVLFYRRK